ncbi:hypothetical protein GCM10007921_12010 [Tritonibacter mobilis]|nr:hypothetical protein GCM10007921_12010 [Tritonibacter mobilis]
MIGDASEHPSQLGLRIYVVQLGGLDQREGDGHGFSAAFGTGKHPVFPADGQFPFILPMSGRFIGFIIDGMPILART